MPEYIVGSVNDAVSLAREWQAAGTHSWFRGQNSTWPLLSSLGRKLAKPKGAEEVTGRIAQFMAWLKDVPQLKHLREREHVHAFFAVLQHYGVPTHYVDFSTSPEKAGFFAACGPDAKKGEQGCILCIDPDRIVSWCRAVAEVRAYPKESWPEKVEVSVDGLWRMQAQSGHFIYLPIGSVENIYPPDRIIFTHGGEPYHIAKEEIYPRRKSMLEILLDQFFTQELMQNNQAYLQQLFAEWEQKDMPVLVTRFEDADRSHVLRPATMPHPSWTRAQDEWTVVADQHWDDVRTGDEIPIACDLSAAPAQFAARAEDAFLYILRSRPELREKAVNWSPVLSGRDVTPDWVESAKRRLARVWDGMRRLPYTDEQLAAALGATLATSACDETGNPLRDLTPLFGDTLKVELATSDGVTARAIVNARDLVAAFREDLDSILADGAPTPSDPCLLLQVLNAPSYLFDFARLVDLFAREIVPTETLIQRDDLAVFFSPASVTVLGMP